ncbi:MAG: TRCF domain-containing protein, partial [Psychroflexus sp.]
QKILNEAIEELKENEFKTVYQNDEDEADKVYVKDAQIDTDFEILFPDHYINSIKERLNLYTKLNEVKDEKELLTFEKELLDRFGELPQEAEDLLNSVRLKWIAASIGLEKIVLKKAKMIGYFLSNQQSDFYQSKRFREVLQYVQMHPRNCQMKEKETRNGLRLLLTFEKITSVNRALEVLKPLEQKETSEAQ